MDAHIRSLVEVFQANPWQFFHETEIHCQFFQICREGYGIGRTSDGCDVHLLRQDYNTLWRYSRPAGFAQRFSGGRTATGVLDFVVLKREFVENNPYLTVMNKEERRRNPLRNPNPWDDHTMSPMMDRALEFKMAHAHSIGAAMGVPPGAFALDGMMLDCRKLANERPNVAYAVGFTHQPVLNWLNAVYMAALFQQFVSEWRGCDNWAAANEERLRLLIVSPTQCFQWGTWDVHFPSEFAV